MSKTIHCTNPNCGALIEIPENATQIICPECNLWHFPNAYDAGNTPGADTGEYGIPAVTEYQETSADDRYNETADPYKTPTSNQHYQTPNVDPPQQAPEQAAVNPPAPQNAPVNPYNTPAVDEYQTPAIENRDEPVNPYQPPQQDSYSNAAADQYQAPVDQNYNDMGQKPPLVTEYQEAGRDDEIKRNQSLAQSKEKEISFGFLITETGERLKLNEGENVIGRKGTDLIIDDKTVSRKHCVVEVIVGASGQVEHMIYDIGHSEGASSTNGVFISGRSLRLQDYERIQIRDGSAIQIGSVRLQLQTG